MMLDHFCAQHSNAQILELGAGLSLHGLALAERYDGIDYLETDLADMIRLKETIMGKLGRVPQNLRFADANALDEEALSNALLKTRSHAPIAIYCEGFIDYLSLKEKETLVEIIKHMLSRFGGQWITPDPSVSIERRAFQASFMSGARERTKQVESIVGQRYDDHAFANEADADAFFQKNGFMVVKYAQPIKLNSFSAANIQKELEPKIIEDIRQYGKVWVMSLP
jgi:O-methyltransferase involved in polyketide biosynthesis